MKIRHSPTTRHYLARFSVFLIMAALIAGMTGCDGSQSLEIRTWYDLDAVRDNLAGNHTLMNDLDSTTPGYEELASPTANGGLGWQPIGAWNIEFTGIFDGQGYEIRDLFIARPGGDYVGLFGTVDGTAVIRNVGVVNADVSGDHRVGALIGSNWGSVLNCYSTGSVSGVQWVGGLVGLNDGWGDMVPAVATIDDSYSAAAIIDNSYSAASVSGNQSGIGGLLGLNGAGTLSRSYSTGNVTGQTWVGGLVGLNNEGTVSKCYSTGNVTGNSSAAGLVGENMRSTVSNSFWDTQTSGQATSDGGTGKNTTEMQDITTFSVAGWNIIAVALNETNPAYIWNIVNNVTYPFLSWQL